MNNYLIMGCIVLAPTFMHGMVKMPDIKTFNQQVEVVASVCYTNHDLSDHQRYCAQVVVNELHAYGNHLVDRLHSKDTLKNKDKEYLRDRVACEYKANIDRIMAQRKAEAESDEKRFALEKQEQDASSFRSKLMLSSLASIVVYALFLI